MKISQHLNNEGIDMLKLTEIVGCMVLIFLLIFFLFFFFFFLEFLIRKVIPDWVNKCRKCGSHFTYIEESMDFFNGTQVWQERWRYCILCKHRQLLNRRNANSQILFIKKVSTSKNNQ